MEVTLNVLYEGLELHAHVFLITWVVLITTK